MLTVCKMLFRAPKFWTESPQRQPRVAQDSSENARPQRRSRDLSSDGQFDQKVKQYTMATNRLRAFEGTVTSFLMSKHFAGVVPSRPYTTSSYYGTILSLIDAIKFATPGYQPHVQNFRSQQLEPTRKVHANKDAAFHCQPKSRNNASVQE